MCSVSFGPLGGSPLGSSRSCSPCRRISGSPLRVELLQGLGAPHNTILRCQIRGLEDMTVMVFSMRGHTFPPVWRHTR